MNGIVVDSMEMVAHSAVSWTELTLDRASDAIIAHMATVILVAGSQHKLDVREGDIWCLLGQGARKITREPPPALQGSFL